MSETTSVVDYQSPAAEPSSMPAITIALGLILSVVGVAGYFLSGRASVTALIPAFFGVPLLVLGVVARKPGARKHAMHAAAALALLGLAGCIPGVIKLARFLAGGEAPQRPGAVYVQSLMAVLCLVFLALCVRSFISARRSRIA